MNKKIFKILICCIMILLLFSNSTHLKSIALDETPIIVKNFNQFKNTLENVNDGDVIYLDGGAIILDFDTNTTIGYSDKTITIKRRNGSSHILLTGTKNIKFKNIIFDGEGVNSNESIIKTYGEYYPLASVTFENVIFQNFSGNSSSIFLDTGLITFKNCIFKNNKGSYGGHVQIRQDADVNFYKCSFIEGQSSCGGAIALMSSNAFCNIISSTITNNSANEGGGIYNLGDLTIENTKIYNNTASNGGSDIYNTGTLNIIDSIEDLQKLFFDSELKPIAWVSDYNDDNSYLKLAFGIIEEENQDENNQDNNPSNNETEKNQNNDNTPNENNTNNENTENNQQEENNTNSENTEPSNQEENSNKPEPQNTSNEENENNNSEPSDENISTPTSNNDTNNKTVTNTSHNEANDNTSNTNTDESSFVQRIIDKITETFNVQNPTTQQITDDSSKSVTNKNESPVNQKIYITDSPSTKITDDKSIKTNSNETESNIPSNQTFNFSFELKNNDNNNNLLMIFIFIQSIMTFVIVIIQNKQNNRHHRYKNKKHTRKH